MIPGMNAHDVTHCLLRPAIAAFTLALFAFSPSTVAAQVAGRPITIIVPYTPGTGIDILARALGAELARHWGQPVVVDNKPGASGNIGTQVAARAAPDGQTLLMIAKTFVTNGSLFKNVPYDPVKSFVPVIKLATGSIVLAVHPSVPADSVAAFIQYVKARPGEVNYGSPGFATPHHLAMELFKHATQTDLVHIPYKGTSGVMSDLVGNHVSAMFVPTHVALPLAADKQIRILGVASAERVAGRARCADACRAGRDRFRGRHLVRAPGARRNAGRCGRTLQCGHQRVPALACGDGRRWPSKD